MTAQVLVIGSNGQLGSSIRNQTNLINSEFTFFFADRNIIDLSNISSIDEFFSMKKFKIIINCGAFTNVDGAEREKELCDKVNNQAVQRIAYFARKHHSKFIHISTDYVFNGQSSHPYLESDNPIPINNYGLSKFLGEKSLIQKMNENAIVIRTGWLYSEFGKNFLKTMIRLAKDRDSISVVNDQIGTPTYAVDLAKAILKIIGTPSFLCDSFNSDILHYSNLGSASWYEFASKIFEFSGINITLKPIKSSEYEVAATRPKYTVLDNNKIQQQFNLTINHWEDSLKDCIKKIN